MEVSARFILAVDIFLSLQPKFLKWANAFKLGMNLHAAVLELSIPTCRHKGLDATVDLISRLYLPAFKIMCSCCCFVRLHKKELDVWKNVSLTSLKLSLPSKSSSTSLIMFLRPRWVCGAPSFSIISFSSIKSMKPSLPVSYLKKT